MPEWLERLRPPKARRRKREARRWLDLLDVFTTNGLPRDRWPGQRLLMPSESWVVRQEALARLERRDPELLWAVEYVRYERSVAQSALSWREQRRQGAINFARLSRLRRAIRRERLKAASGR